MRSARSLRLRIESARETDGAGGIASTGGTCCTGGIDCVGGIGMFTSVIRFAIDAHRGQKRKGTKTPYIVHPLEVAMILQQDGATEAVVYAGLLHDVLEDTDKGEEDIMELFGENEKMAREVLEIVKGVTEPSKLERKKIPHQKWTATSNGRESESNGDLGQHPGQHPGQPSGQVEEAPWRERKEHTITYLAGLQQQGLDRDIKRVACADKLSNIRSMLYDYEAYVRNKRSGNLLWRRFNRESTCANQEWYYRELIASMADLRGQRGCLMYDEFAAKVNELFGKAEVRAYMKRQGRRRKCSS